jgi:hypothetical protein
MLRCVSQQTGNLPIIRQSLPIHIIRWLYLCISASSTFVEKHSSIRY